MTNLATRFALQDALLSGGPIPDLSPFLPVRGDEPLEELLLRLRPSLEQCHRGIVLAFDCGGAENLRRGLLIEMLTLRDPPRAQAPEANPLMNLDLFPLI